MLPPLPTHDDFTPVTDTPLSALLTTPRPHKLVDVAYSQSISAGKNTYVYDAHTYHTKVPPQGIRALIDYYTAPGDLVLDPFCGSGMTGVAALEAGRLAILSDLSPAAVFIARNLTTPIDDESFLMAVDALLAQASDLNRRLYTTTCRICGRHTTLLYTVWSYGVLCSHCGHECILWDVIRDERETPRLSKIKSSFDCPHCGTRVAKRGLKRTQLYPVQVGYKCCAPGLKEQTAPPSEGDIRLLRDLESVRPPAPLWFPTDKFPLGMNTRQPIAAGIDSVDKAYTPRALWAMAFLWHHAAAHPAPRLREKLLFTITSLYQRVTLFSEFRFWGGSGNTANYNVPHLINEQNVFLAFKRKAATIALYFRHAPRIERRIHTAIHSACDLSHLPDDCVDYVFTDPPFGSNINYSEMNFLWESWLRNHTDAGDEAIISKAQHKSLDDYRTLLSRAFSELHRVLRSTGWLTVVFHNSSDQVWGALQDALTAAGFDLRATQMFDKQHATFKMLVSSNAVGYDLVLHCRKRARATPPPIPLITLPDAAARSFVRRSLTGGTAYRVHYRHVPRDDEFDYRRLYAEWLCSSLAKAHVSLDFESFRALVDDVREDLQQ